MGKKKFPKATSIEDVVIEKARGVNFSQVLQDALRQEFDID
ncbi:hypothetical protein [Peptostreptococcus anaerobius]|nr:hypothetical protein [Peptostreptococcus anaerobius]EKX91848.1 hypothetical protein HMPREF9998_01272 [Peptostreptococcus anaerobius VPI 4330 = DSM 2949]